MLARKKSIDGAAIYRHSYNNFLSALAEFGRDTKLRNFINEEYGSKLATNNECVCHSDFWPGNVLVRVRNEAEKDVDLTIVD
jgi:hypothetical protein